MNPDQSTRLEGTKLAEFTPISSVPELKITDTVEGTGDAVIPGATITAHYTGALAADGTIFQSSKDMGNPITFGLNQVIAGWQTGVPGMKIGGTRRLVIPAAMAYGTNSPAPNIPANSDLVFDIELVRIG
ncbi:MAG TPA: FKBP-type peptidyl-prolyl cis-trans isomerase [Candidatus Saccharimonadales bacterium]|jgi:FKBP-type peptidyl-prolyl cis-trans isomerase|nr:FKBP-type peptidyl-prolyl cis-trans isomerase [Candidatus Saccharimonadales bacterium]